MTSIPRTSSVYQIRHTVSNRVYVGSAIDPRQRWATHLRQLKSGQHHSRYLQRAWDKYGAEAFVFEIIEPVLFIEDLIIREQYWLDSLRAHDQRYGFNVYPTAGSALGSHHDDAARAKMSAAHRGRETTAEHRANLIRAKSQEWWVCSPEGAEQIITGLKQFCANNDLLYHKMQEVASGRSGRHRGWGCVNLFDLQADAKIDAARVYERNYSGGSRAYIVTPPEGDSFTVHNLQAFCDANGLDANAMRKVASHRFFIGHKTHKGYTCRYPEK